MNPRQQDKANLKDEIIIHCLTIKTVRHIQNDDSNGFQILKLKFKYLRIIIACIDITSISVNIEAIAAPLCKNCGIKK